MAQSLLAFFTLTRWLTERSIAKMIISSQNHRDNPLGTPLLLIGGRVLLQASFCIIHLIASLPDHTFLCIKLSLSQTESIKHKSVHKEGLFGGQLVEIIMCRIGGLWLRHKPPILHGYFPHLFLSRFIFSRSSR